MRIPGTRVLITGGSSGIGAATARALVERGASILLIARDSSRLEAVAEGIRAGGGRVQTYVADLAKPQEVHGVARRLIETDGVPDILINNAGAGRWRAIHETSADELAAAVAVPFMAAFNLTRELLPGFRARGSGHIVNVSSVGSFMAWPEAAAYIATRWAIRGFTEFSGRSCMARQSASRWWRSRRCAASSGNTIRGAGSDCPWRRVAYGR